MKLQVWGSLETGMNAWQRLCVVFIWFEWAKLEEINPFVINSDGFWMQRE